VPCDEALARTERGEKGTQGPNPCVGEGKSRGRGGGFSIRYLRIGGGKKKKGFTDLIGGKKKGGGLPQGPLYGQWLEGKKGGEGCEFAPQPFL